MVATAFVSQMDSEAENLRSAKAEMEKALAEGKDLKAPREALDLANSKYKTASVQIRKHTAKPAAKKTAAPPAPTA